MDTITQLLLLLLLLVGVTLPGSAQESNDGTPYIHEGDWKFIMRTIHLDLKGLIEDVDECSETDICSHDEICHNTPGSYRCICPLGFKKEGDICQDVDECSGNDEICGNHYTCRNNPCICDKYFKKVGNICQGPVCESPSLFLPELGCLTLEEELMTWDEAKSRCQVLGGRLAVGFKRRNTQTLNEHFFRYGGIWVGLKDGQWIHEEGEEEEEVSSADWDTQYPSGRRNRCGLLSVGGLREYPCSRGFLPLCQSLP